jgi:metal-sulfur cluster biosynthetic enzyme
MTDTTWDVGRLLGADDDAAPVWAALQTVMDPELGVNIVDLGLVYGVEKHAGRVDVVMTMTTPACPIGDYLEDQVRWALLSLPGVLDVTVVVVHNPPWSPDRMNDAAKERLGWMR